MNPWRAALTSATASGKSTRIASRSAIACSSGPPWTCSWPSAAAVSSTAVFSVSVANCSRCASCTDSACCSANSRSPRIRSSGSPPKGKPKPPDPSISTSLASELASTRRTPELPSPAGRAGGYVPHVEPAEQRECDHAHERRSRRQVSFDAVLVVAAEEREAAQVYLDSLGDIEVRAAEHAEREDRHRRRVELGLPEIEIRAAEERDDDASARDAPAALSLAPAEDRERQALRALSRACGGSRQVTRHLLELAARARAVDRLHPLRELLERQPAVRGGVAKRRDDLLALVVRGAQLDLVAHLSSS